MFFFPNLHPFANGKGNSKYFPIPAHFYFGFAFFFVVFLCPRWVDALFHCNISFTATTNVSSVFSFRSLFPEIRAPRRRRTEEKILCVCKILRTKKAAQIHIISHLKFWLHFVDWIICLFTWRGEWWIYIFFLFFLDCPRLICVVTKNQLQNERTNEWKCSRDVVVLVNQK